MKNSQCLNPNCLYSNPNNYNFCQRCGSKLLLCDRYRPIRYIGEGGFGRTYEAVDEHRLDTPCVIKQFLPLQSGSQALQKATELFKQEAIQLNELGKHPQIPDLLAFFEQEERLYLIQEFIDGQDLLKELTQRTRFSEEEVRQFLLDLLPVLEFIHDKNIIHRDIKPDNIIHRQNGDLVLIDFGISKQLSTTVMTKMGTIVGTIGYAAPEQMKGMISPASDIYSLGVTAVRLLTGYLPEDRNGSFVDEIFDPLEMEWTWREWVEKNQISVSEDLAKVLDKMIQEKVRDRFATAGEVLKSLQPAKIKVAKLYEEAIQEIDRILAHGATKLGLDKVNGLFQSATDADIERICSLIDNQEFNKLILSRYVSVQRFSIAFVCFVKADQYIALLEDIREDILQQ